MKNLFLFIFISISSFQSFADVADDFSKTQKKAIFQNLNDRVICPGSESYLFDLVYRSLDQSTQVKSLDLSINLNLRIDSIPTEHQIEFQKRQAEFLEIINSISAESVQQWREKIAAAEIGIQDSPEEIILQKKLKRFYKKWQVFQDKVRQKNKSKGLEAKELDTLCSDYSRNGIRLGDQVQSVNRVAFGGRKVLATAYQSCTSDEKKPMDVSTENVRGIKIIGLHPDGVGNKRVISDIDELLASNYYYQGVVQGPQCQNIRSVPVIYDYGGKPSTRTGALNLFVNAGDGTSVLGIDCSGYVFSALATAGLRLAPNKAVKADLVHGLSSRAYLNPEKNGLTCFQRVSMGNTGTLKQGDIVAVNGHVLIIDTVGADPLGIQKANSLEQCQEIQISDFDFVVMQSSPSKEGIGINKFVAKDYLVDAEKMRIGFLKYAQDACRFRLQGKSALPQSPSFLVIRHKLTPSCLTGQPVSLTGQACISSCPSLYYR